MLPALTWAQEGTKPIVTSDVLKLKTSSGIHISANGQRVVFTVREMRHDQDDELAYFSHLWLADLNDERPPRQLTHGERHDASPRFSPDGKRIAFLREKDGIPQVWILPLDGGEAWALTAAPHGAAQPRWSPDGKRIAFGSEVPLHALEGELPWPYERPGRRFRDTPNWRAIHEAEDAPPPETAVTPRPDGSLAEIRAWLAENASEDDPKVLTRLDLQDELGLADDPSFYHLFVIAVAPEAEAVQLTHGYQDFGQTSWAPDGKSILTASTVYPQHPDFVYDSDLWLVPVDGSGARQLVDWPGWMLFAARFSPDGSQILFSAIDQQDYVYGLVWLATVPTAGGTPRFLTRETDGDAMQATWSADGQHVYFTTRRTGTFPLLRIPAAGGAVETIVGGPRGVRDFDLEGDRLVFAATEVAAPWELYQADAQGQQERPLGALNRDWLKERRVVQPTEHWVTRPDGERVQYWVMEPAERAPGVKYPVVLAIHGGPAAMWGPGQFTLWHEFQLLTSWGYGVVYSNPRGSSGYGYEFKHANFRNWGVGPAGDILAALDEAVALPWVDRDQLVVTGGSYAGYMTAWIITQDHRFKAAVAQRGVYEIALFFGEGNAWRLVPHHFGGYPWEAETRAALETNSPLTFVDDIRTPLLIIHGDYDLRTGVSQSEMLYKSLKILGRPVEYVRYPDEGHELSRSGHPKRRMDRLNRIVEFFERYITHPSTPPATQP